MTTEITICLLICLGTFALYLWNPYKSLGTTSVISILVLYAARCVDKDVIASCFGSTTALLTCGMFVIAAGFSHTQLVKNIAKLVRHISKGSLTKVMIGYIALAILLCNVVPSNLVPFSILYPLLDATVREMDISPSKVMFSLGITCIVCCGALPIGSGAMTYETLNAIIASNGGIASVNPLDPALGRLPLLVLMFVYCSFIAPKLAPAQSAVEAGGMKNAAAEAAVNQAELPKFQEISGITIFFASTFLLVFSSKIGIENWQIALAGAVLMVITKVLKPAEASRAIPIRAYLLLVGGLVMANALGQTGAGSLVGEFVAGIAGAGRSNIVFYLVFFCGPFILTQFILNQTAMNIFYPIVAQTCIALGVNPTGAMICVMAGGFSAFFTPMATGTVPYMMAAGGYDIRQLIKQSALPFLLCIVVTVLWMSFVFPVF